VVWRATKIKLANMGIRNLLKDQNLGSVWLKSQVERSRSVPVSLLFGYKVTRTEWFQLGNILHRSGTIPLQKINRTEPLCSQPARTVTRLRYLLISTSVTLRPNKGWSRSVPVHSETKQKTEPLRSSLPNTEQSGSVSRIRDGTAPFYLAPQPNTTLRNEQHCGKITGKQG
jgi:hypothetical protein